MGVPGIKQRPETVLRCKIKGYTQTDIYAGYPGHLYFLFPSDGWISGQRGGYSVYMLFVFLLCHLVVTTSESPVKSVYEGITGAMTVSV